jgi:hypothetical protein
MLGGKHGAVMDTDRNVGLNEAGVLVWLPDGKTPDDGDFDISSVQGPPLPNPEPWWQALDGINSACRLIWQTAVDESRRSNLIA